MKFERILKKIKEGKKVTREKWETPGDSCAIDFIVYDKYKGKCVFYRDNKYYDEFVWLYEDMIAQDWKVYEEPNQVWKAKNNEEFYYLCSDNNGIYSKTNGYSYNDKCKIDIGNCFKTKKEAHHMLQKIQIITQLRKLSNISFNDDYNQPKFAIYYDIEKQEISYAVHHLNREIPFNIYFKNEEDCQNVIETIGEDNLKKYYFDVEE